MSTFPVRKVIVKKATSTKKASSTIKTSNLKYRPQIRSRHPSHATLRQGLPTLPVRSIVRLGSTTTLSESAMEGRVEVNTVNSVSTSSNKRLMKNAFIKAGVKTAQGFEYVKGNIFKDMSTAKEYKLEELPYPIVAKSLHGSRGEGNFLIELPEDMKEWLSRYTPSNSIFEKFHPYNREYRIHVTEDGCFYTCRKVLKKDTPEEYRWFRNDTNSTWIVEENSLFEKPSNWNKIVAESVKALKAVGLDIGAIDVRVQNEITAKGKKRLEPDFIILETNSAPSFGEITTKKYLAEIPKVILKKAGI